MGMMLVMALGLAPVEALRAQQEVISPVYSFQIREKIEPPILERVSGSVRLVDADGNGAVDAMEACQVVFAVSNDGLGDGVGLRAQVILSGAKAGIEAREWHDLPVARLGQTTQYTIPFEATRATVDGVMQLAVEVHEPNGFGLELWVLEVETRAFRAPKVEVVDYRLSGEGGVLQKKSRFSLEWLVQNTGQGVAQGVTTELQLPEGVFQLVGEKAETLGDLGPGEERRLAYEFIINTQYASESVPIGLQLRERLGAYGAAWEHVFQLNEAVSQERLVVQPAAQQQTVAVERSYLGSDVDRNVPKWGPEVAHRYAVVIGNEDYASRSGALSPEINVDFAENDARMVAHYLQQSLGVPAAHLRLRINATAGELRQEVNWLANVARAEGGRAEIYFYYSGHGLPAGEENVPYLIPVDVSGQQAALGIALPELYRTLTEHPVVRAHVWLDACFSGGARNEELVAMKGVRVVPRTDAIPERLLVLASSSGNQASGVYRAEQHGHFTYQLLKAVQTSSPTTTWGEVFTRVQREVDLATAKEGYVQQPQALSAPASSGLWEGWKLR